MNNNGRISGFVKKPWFISVSTACIIPLFPEYFAPLLAGVSLYAARKDCLRRDEILKVGNIGKIMLAYIAFLFFGLTYSSGFLSTLSTLGMWGVMFLVYLSIFNVVIDKSRLDILFFVIGIVAAIAGIISLFQYTGYVLFDIQTKSFWDFADMKIMETFNERIIMRNYTGRTSSTFNNPNIFAMYMVMAFPFAAIYFFKDVENKKLRIINAVGLFSIASGIAFSFSRGSYIALFIMTSIFCIFNIKRVTMLAMLTYSGFFLFPGPVAQRIFSIMFMDNSTQARLNVWFSGIGIIRQSPVLGIGAGVMNTWDHIIEKGITGVPHMHNLFLQLFVEGGIISLALFSIAAWYVIRLCSNLCYNEKDLQLTAVTFSSFLIGFMVIGITDFPLMTPKLVGMFLTVVAAADCIYRLYPEQKLYNKLPHVTKKIGMPVPGIFGRILRR